MRIPAPVLPALLYLFLAWPGRCESLLQLGLSLEYSMEMLSEGRRSEERLLLSLPEQIDAERWRLELTLGEGASRYRALYTTAGPASAFAASRFEQMECWEESWLPVDPADLDLLATLVDMEARLSGRSWEAESTFIISGRELVCRRYTIADSLETVQEGESVTLRTRQVLRGEVWLNEDLPFGGWVRYREECSARKISEFAGRLFEGKEERTRETWTLTALRWDAAKLER